jgi:alpha-glucosidase
MRLLPVNSSDQADLQDIAAEFRSVLAEYTHDPVLIGEIYQPVERLARFYGEGQAGFDLPFNFNLMWLDWCPAGVLNLIQRYEAALPKCAWPTWVLGNHDQHRVASRLGAAQARVAMMLLLTLRGTPTLYQGDELGLEDGNITADRLRDPFARLDPTRGRDPFRTPMPWDGAKFGSFSSVEPWLPLSSTDPGLSVSFQLAHDQSMLALTKRCLALRRREPALKSGKWEGVSSDDSVLIYRRSCEQSRLLIALNFKSERSEARIPAANAVRLISTHGQCVPSAVDRNLELLPDEGIILSISE